MPHCTPEQIALAALREPLPASDAAHLESCARCRAEVASLRRGVDTLAVPQLAAPGTPVAPPPGVWAAIAAATGVDVAPRPEAVAGTSAGFPSAPPASAAPPAPAGMRPAAEPPPAPVTPLRPRRSRLLLAAAAALVVGAAIGAGAVAFGTRSGEELTVASTTLQPLDDSGASGEARVLERNDGSLVLDVDLSAKSPEDGYYEVWLLDRSVSRLMAMGVVQGGDTAVFELPPGLDLGDYPLVDVSLEPLDGNPAHSGVSVARGELAT